MTRWNNIPLTRDANPERTAAEFDAQYAENKAEADAKREDSPTPNLDAYEKRQSK